MASPSLTSERNQVGAAAAALALLVFGGAALGGWALWTRSVDAQAGPQVFDPAPSAQSRSRDESVSSDTIDAFDLRVDQAMRQSDGSWRILLTARREGPGTLDVIRFTNVRIADVPMDCQVYVMPGPFGEMIDLVIQTPPLPEDLETVHVTYDLYLESAGEGSRETCTASGSFEAAVGT